MAKNGPLNGKLIKIRNKEKKYRPKKEEEINYNSEKEIVY